MRHPSGLQACMGAMPESPLYHPSHPMAQKVSPLPRACKPSCALAHTRGHGHTKRHYPCSLMPLQGPTKYMLAELAASGRPAGCSLPPRILVLAPSRANQKGLRWS
jgi:hypothetical protein